MNQDDFIKILTPNQFEIKSGYLAHHTLKKVDYNVNIYFFIPKNLGINERTYSNDDFYNNFISYIRLLTPKYELGIIKNKLKGLILALEKNLDNENEKSAIRHEIKLTICSYTSYIKKFTNDTVQKGVKPDRIKVLLKRIKEIKELREDFLKLKEKVDENDEKTKEIIMWGCEYLSLTTQNYLFKLNIHLNSLDKRYTDLINSILTTINEEIKFCKKNGFPIISNDEYENERVIYRYSVFKKYFYSVLYLYQNREIDGKGVKEIYYAIAAGISMLFTTIVIFAIQKQYGSLTTSLFVALVISYMFKDRLKEAYRHYFDKKLKMKVFDFKEKIYDSEKKVLFAFIKERMRFVKKQNLNENIIKTRLNNTQNRLSTWYIGEEIIKYEKQITLYNKNIQNYYNNNIEGIQNIMRFDISRFLHNMDYPKVPLYRIGEGKLYGEKVYHLNLVIEFKSQTETIYHKARIILTKKGIKRIELPESNITLFREDKILKKQKWFWLKKSGLLKKL